MRPVKSKELTLLSEMFRRDMEEIGYQIFPDNNVWMPSLTAVKRNHYRVSAIRFLDPGSPSFAMHGNVGTDIHDVFYFSIQPPFNNIEERYEKMMEAARPFLEKELNEETLRVEF